MIIWMTSMHGRAWDCIPFFSRTAPSLSCTVQQSTLPPWEEMLRVVAVAIPLIFSTAVWALVQCLVCHLACHGWLHSNRVLSIIEMIEKTFHQSAYTRTINCSWFWATLMRVRPCPTKWTSDVFSYFRRWVTYRQWNAKTKNSCLVNNRRFDV